METEGRPASPPSSTLSPEAPVDAAFRWLANVAGERVVSHGEPAGDGSSWATCQRLARYFAQWSRQLPSFLQGRVTAADLAVALAVLSGLLPPEEDEARQVHRRACRQMGQLLAEGGVEPCGQIFLVAALWSVFEVRVTGMATAARAAQQQGTKAERRVATDNFEQTLMLRENLVRDVRDLTIIGAQLLLEAAPPGAAGIAAGAVDLKDGKRTP